MNELKQKSLLPHLTEYLYLENNYKMEYAHFEMQEWKYVRVEIKTSTSNNVDCSTTASCSCV